MTTSTTARITGHQLEVLSRLERLSGAQGRWVEEKAVGSRQGLAHLVAKGYAVELISSGPRGGVLRSFRPARFGGPVSYVKADSVPAEFVKYFDGVEPVLAQAYFSGAGWDKVTGRPTIERLQALQGCGATHVALSVGSRIADFSITAVLS